MKLALVTLGLCALALAAQDMITVHIQIQSSTNLAQPWQDEWWVEVPDFATNTPGKYWRVITSITNTPNPVTNSNQ